MGEKKTKDYQPPFQEPRESFGSEEIAEGLDRPGRKEIKDITDEGSHRDPDDVLRQTLQGSERSGGPDAGDGREETKQDKAEAANQNG